jgi:hypothetical protein
MDKLFIRLEFKGAATVQNCQEVLDLIRQHNMVKSVEFVINGQHTGDSNEKKEQSNVVL